MPITQKKSKVIIKDEAGLVQLLPETSIEAIDGLSTELASVVHTSGAESIDGVKNFNKNTMTTAVALSGSEINVSTGSFFTKTISADTTFTFTGMPAGKACVFTLVLTNAGSYDVTFPNNVTWMGGDVPTLHETGVDCLTFFTVDGGTSWMEVSASGIEGDSSGGEGSATIPDSGVVAGSYGPSTNEVPDYGETFTVPQITVNQKGQVTNAVNKTVTIPASDNTDLKVAVVENGWSKSYLMAVDAVNAISGSPIAVTAIADTGVYLGTTPGHLHAGQFNGPLNGNASSATKATQDGDGNVIKTTYATLASPDLTGTPTAPTAAAGTNTGQIATTAFVQNAISGLSPSSGGSGEGTGTLPDSGVTSGSYGPNADSAPQYGGTFVVPEFIVNQKGQITSATNRTITIPATDNTDTKVNVTLATTAKAYLLGTTTAPTATAAGVSAVADTGVYLDTTAGTLTATKFVGAAEDANGNAYATQSYVATAISNSGTGSDSGTKEISYVAVEPTDSSTSTLGNESLIFFEDSSISGTPGSIITSSVYVGADSTSSGVSGLVPAASSAERNYFLQGDGTWTAGVHIAGSETISGAKTFAQGPYGTTSAVSASEINLADGTVFTKTVSANTTFTITGVPSGTACSFSLLLTNGGAYAVAWPASVKWAGGNVPTLTESGVDLLTFLTPDGGTTWYGVLSVGGAA